MIKLLFELYEFQPKVMISKIMNQLYWQNEGQKMRRKALQELRKLKLVGTKLL